MGKIARLPFYFQIYRCQMIHYYMNRESIEQQLKREIADIEHQIYDLETFYLENTRDSVSMVLARVT